MLTTWPLAALVVFVVVFVLATVVASALCRKAMRLGARFEANIAIASFRFNVSTQPQPREAMAPPDNAADELHPSQDLTKKHVGS